MFVNMFCCMFQVSLRLRTPHTRQVAVTRAILVSDCHTPQVITWQIYIIITITITLWRYCRTPWSTWAQGCTAVPRAPCIPCPCERESVVTGPTHALFTWGQPREPPHSQIITLTNSLSLFLSLFIFSFLLKLHNQYKIIVRLLCINIL